MACGLTVFAGLIPFKGSTVSETQLAEVPCAHPRSGLCRSRCLSPSFSRVAYLTPRTCPRHPSSLSSMLSPLATLALQPCHRRPRASPLFSSLPLSSPSPVSSRPCHHRTRCRSPLTQPSACLTVALASDAGSLHHARVGSRSHAGSDCQLLAFTV